MAISILCPGCAVQLGLPDEAAGANVGCPRCGTRMRVPRPAAPPPVPPPAPPREEQKPRPRQLVRVPDEDEDEVEERPRKKRSSDDRPRRKKMKEEDTSGIWIGVGVAAGVLVAVTIVAVILAQPNEKKPSSEAPRNVTIVPAGIDPNGSMTNPNAGPITVPGTIPGPIGHPVGGSIPGIRPPLPPGWVEFTHPEEGFRVYVPAPPIKGDDFGSRGLRLNQPLKSGEERNSIYGVPSTADQPLACMMTVAVYGPNKPPRPYDLMSRPADTPDIKVTEFQIVNWGGRPASEGAGEHTMRFNGDNPPPKVVYRVGRVQDLPERLYLFSIQRDDRMPNAIERAAFFDSFVPGK